MFSYKHPKKKLSVQALSILASFFFLQDFRDFVPSSSATPVNASYYMGGLYNPNTPFGYGEPGYGPYGQNAYIGIFLYVLFRYFQYLFAGPINQWLGYWAEPSL